MGRSRPGRRAGQVAVLAVLLGSLSTSRPTLAARPEAPIATGASAPRGRPIGAVTDAILAPESRPAVEPAAPDPPGPDTPGVTSLVSAWTPTASTGAGPSIQPDISNDGRFVVYASTATAIVSGVTGDWSRIYELDRTTGLTTLVSSTVVTVGGKLDQLPRNSQAVEPSVDADGRLIAYVLVTPPSVGAAVVPSQSFIIIHDNATGLDVELEPGSRPSISADGQLVAIETTTALDPTLDTNKLADIYLVDRASGTATLVSKAADGRAPAAASTQPSLSADGQSVAFTSAGRLLAVDHDPAADIYLRRLPSSTTVLVSVHAGADSGASTSPSVSADGRFVAFSSRAATLAPGPRAGGGSLADVYVRDAVAKKTMRLSRAAGGGAADGASAAPGISADGRTIAFGSTADDLVPADTNHGADIFIVDRASGRITRASITTAGGQAAPASSAAVLSADGAVVAFQSTAQDLAAGAHGGSDVYLRERLPRAAVSPLSLSFAARPAGSSSAPQVVTVRSVGAGPLLVMAAVLAGADPAAFALVSNTCSGAVLEHGQTCAVGVSFQPAVAGNSLASLVVTDNDPGGSQSVALDGGTLTPTIVLDPPLGPPGFVSAAIGANFPPGATISLVWSTGLTASMAPVVADPSGSFRVPMLILPRDTLGPRILTGTFSAAGGGTAQSPPFLVVPGSGQPPFDAGRYPGQPGGPIFRR